MGQNTPEQDPKSLDILFPSRHFNKHKLLKACRDCVDKYRSPPDNEFDQNHAPCQEHHEQINAYGDRRKKIFGYAIRRRMKILFSDLEIRKLYAG